MFTSYLNQVAHVPLLSTGNPRQLVIGNTALMEYADYVAVNMYLRHSFSNGAVTVHMYTYSTPFYVNRVITMSY